MGAGGYAMKMNPAQAHRVELRLARDIDMDEKTAMADHLKWAKKPATMNLFAWLRFHRVDMERGPWKGHSAHYFKASIRDGAVVNAYLRTKGCRSPDVRPWCFTLILALFP